MFWVIAIMVILGGPIAWALIKGITRSVADAIVASVN